MKFLRVFLVLSIALLGMVNLTPTQKAASQERIQPVSATIQQIAEANSAAAPRMTLSYVAPGLDRMTIAF